MTNRELKRIAKKVEQRKRRLKRKMEKKRLDAASVTERLTHGKL